MKQEFKDRIIKHLNFLDEELKDYVQFTKLTREEYLKNRDKRRNVERWIENIIHTTVDVARIILSIEEMAIPDTYRETVSMLSAVNGLGELDTEKLASWIKFRNIIAHEYLDIKWNSIKKFIEEADLLYKAFSTNIKRYLKHKLESDDT